MEQSLIFLIFFLLVIWSMVFGDLPKLCFPSTMNNPSLFQQIHVHVYLGKIMFTSHPYGSFSKRVIRFVVVRNFGKIVFIISEFPTVWNIQSLNNNKNKEDF